MSAINLRAEESKLMIKHIKIKWCKLKKKGQWLQQQINRI